MKNIVKIFLPAAILLSAILSCTYFEMMQKVKSGTPVFGKESSAIPIDLRGHSVYVKVKINDNPKEYNFILDTGALTTLDTQTATELDLEKGTKIPGGEGAHLIKSKILLSLGDMQVKDFMVPMFDLPEASDADPPIDGFIGSDFLRFFRLTVDYQQKRILLARSTDSSMMTKDGYHIKIKEPLPMRFPLAECLIDGKVEAEAMIDIGSPFAVVLPLAMIEEQDFPPARPLIKAKGIMAKWPFTSSNENYLGRMASFEMGDLKIENIPAIYAELPRKSKHILLGKAFLAQFLFTIDYPGNELILMPSKNIEFKTNVFSTGLGLAKENDKIIVQGLWEGSPADKSDIQLNDQLLEINSQSIRTLSFRQVKTILNDDAIRDVELLIKGRAGETRVVLTKEMLFPE